MSEPYELPNITMSDELRRAAEAKDVTDPDTLAALARFETWLEYAGPPIPHDVADRGKNAVREWAAKHLTAEQREFRNAAVRDPEWREFLFGSNVSAPTVRASELLRQILLDRETIAAEVREEIAADFVRMAGMRNPELSVEENRRYSDWNERVADRIRHPERYSGVAQGTTA